MPILAFILLLFLSIANGRAEAFTPIIVDAAVSDLHVSHFYSFDNRQRRLDAEAILSGRHDSEFTEHHEYAVLLGIPKDSEPRTGDYWVRVEVENRSEQDIALLSDNVTTSSLTQVFMVRAGTRELVRRVTLPDKLRRTTQQFMVPPGAWFIYLEVKPDPFLFPLINLDFKSALGVLKNAADRHILTISYGICLALMAYNFVLALTLRQRAHVIYIAYNILLLLYYEGRYQMMAEQFGFPEIPTWALIPINASTPYFLMAFLYHMLDINRNLPAWKWPVRILFAFWPLLVIYSFIDVTHAHIILYYFLVLLAPISIALAVHSIMKKVPGAHLLLVTTVLPALGTFIHFRSNFFSQWLPMPLIKSAQLIAFDLEMILLSMTIGFKINREQDRLRRKIQHAYAELKTIVYPHQVLQIWEGLPLGRTMPVGESKAFILVFDVVASSKMQLADPRTFLSGIFRECSHLMMENYQTDPLIANAYRVKEMGDGFLCSVGFPFGCPGENAADHSVQLAWQFLEIFRRHVAAANSPNDIHCAIGIAYGQVEAFYPESGAQVYDLFGRGIILAHRYESMRDILFRWLKQKDSIIILHEPVFDQLSSSYQDEFIEVDLLSSDFKVRDDEGAARLYYQLASGRKARRMLRGA